MFVASSLLFYPFEGNEHICK